MPKSFSVTDNTKGFHLTPDVPVHRLYLGMDIARVATYWSDLELHWAIAYTYLLAGKNDVEAFTEYYNLRDWRKRRKQFFDQAKAHRLPAQLRDEATNLYTEFEALAKSRNRIVHGAWAWSEEHNDSVFLAQDRNFGSNLNRVFTGIEKIANHPKRYPELSFNLARGSYEEWTHSDFEAVIGEIAALRNRLMDFGSKVVGHSLEALTRRLRPRS